MVAGAVNAKKNNFTPQKAKDHIARIEASISEYLAKLDATDSHQVNEKQTPSMHDKLAWLKNRLQELKQIEEDVNKHGDKQLSVTDPDARLMKTDNMNRQVCYNVQSAVDTKHHLIVSHDIIQTTDRGNLTLVAEHAQRALRKKDITVIADKGYFSRLDIEPTQDLGMTALVPQVSASGSKTKGIFNKSLFRYDKSRDIYICPVGKELPHRRNVIDKGVEQKVYANHIACRDCHVRSQCTHAKVGPRRMHRWVHEDDIDVMQVRLDNAPDTTVIRKQTVEHPFGTIKMWMGASHFLMKRKKNVSTEMSLHVLAYNLKRMMSIVGIPTLIAAMQEYGWNNV